MKCHQVLTGACNAGNSGFAVGSVEGISFSAYAAGSNIVILSVTFERVQIIPGALHNNVQISCLDTSTDTGKIAAAYGSHVCIYEPTPLVHQNSSHRLDYRWVETGRILSSCFVATLSWNLEGTRLLTGGKVLQLWHFHVPNEEPAGQPIHKSSVKRTVTFELGDDAEDSSDDEPESVSSPEFPEESLAPAASWRLLWENVPASPVTQAAFSPDGTLFATAATQDRLLRIWYEDKPLLFPSRHVDHSAASTPSLDLDAAPNFSFVYIAHPQAVTGFSWRRTSKYMPKGSVCAMLVTSCRDNICRLWVETVLPAGPDDGLGLVSLPHWDPLAHANPKFRTQRHKTRILQRLKHVRHCFHLRRNLKHGQRRGHNHEHMGHSTPPSASASAPLPTFPSTYSVHEYHGFGLHGTGAVLGLHFHLAGAVNAATDIPLVPSLGQGDSSGPPLILHWLNNKEMHFTAQAEQILQELSKKALERENWLHNDGDKSSEATTPSNSESSPLKKKRVRGTTGDLSKFLRHQGHNAHSPGVGEADTIGHPWTHPPSVGTVPAFSPLSGAASMASLATDVHNTQTPMPLGDALDLRIETLLRDWHQSPDLLFAVHPLDGSFLVWMVDWLDEYQPGSFRQPQVSFSSRLPNALPLGDAGTMAPALALYNPTHYLDLRHLLHLDHHTTTPDTNAQYQNLREEDEDEEQSSKTEPNEGEGVAEEENLSKSKKRRPASLLLPTASAGDRTNNKDSSGLSSGNTFHPIPAPVVCLLTKHDNGSLNLWHLAFGEGSHFAQLLSVAHSARVSGHRFRVNDITCHPVLPLLLTTSHHNVVQTVQDAGVSLPTPTLPTSGTRGRHMSVSVVANKGFCSELILWRVEPVGPLSRSGGVTELARINSPAASAFSSVAWVPTLLPAATLASPKLGVRGAGAAHSASACFVASDGTSLRVYQAVIDARSLLSTIERNNVINTLGENDLRQAQYSGGSSASSFYDTVQQVLNSEQSSNQARMVSEQSTSRPGCVLELAPIRDASHDWHNTQLLHVFQEQLMTGRRGTGLVNSSVPVDPEQGPSHDNLGGLGLMEASLGAVVDLQATPTFREPFYVVVLEKADENDGGGSIIHVWKLVIALQPQTAQLEDETTTSTSATSAVSIVTSKVCTQRLPLPEGVEVVDASPAAGHLSSASIYPACFAPYVLVTACSDASVRFWKCTVANDSGDEGEVENLMWSEWNMRAGNSLINVPGTPLSVSTAYSGRVAVAYKAGKSFTKPQSVNPDSRYINLCVAIHECESSGGSEWVLEDTVHFKNIHLPRVRMDPDLDLSYLKDHTWFKRRAQGLQALSRNLSHDDVQSLGGGLVDGTMGDNFSSGSWESSASVNGGSSHNTPVQASVPLPIPNLGHLVAVPSFSTLQTLRQSIQTVGNVCPLTQKFLVQLDWVSKEDGSHILTVGIGSKILLYTCVPERASAHVPVSSSGATVGVGTNLAGSPRRGSLIPAPSISAAAPPSVRWMRLRCLELRTADGLPPLPMHMSWVRDGIFVVGMDNEMHVYSQWKAGADVVLSPSAAAGVTAPAEDWDEDRGLGESTLRSLAAESTPGRLPYATSMAHLPRASSMRTLSAAAGSSASRRPQGNSIAAASLTKKAEQCTDVNSGATTAWLLSECLPSFGLFEAAHLSSPVLPQYHPRQLMELLHSGKAKWVKAILAHLVRCVLGQGANDSGNKKDSKLPMFGGDDDEGELANSDTDDGGDKNNPRRKWCRTRALSISYPGGKEEGNALENTIGVVPEEVTLDYAEISAVPPLPLWTLLAADREESQLPSQQKQRYGQLFGNQTTNGLADEDDGDDLDAILTGSAANQSKARLSEEESGLAYFGLKQARVLTALLTHTQLPGLRSLDQMHLLAVADTVADIYSRGQEQSHHLDSCGVRFLLSVRHHLYLLRCLPPAARVALKRRGLAPAHLVWAFHSQSEEELLQILPQYAKGQPTWDEMREMGVAWWLRSNALLRTAVERLAKCAFQKDNNPLDAAPYYLALGKKAVVWGLFRSQGDERMTQFFSNNFAEERWRKAALKNAYALLGKQRFVHAVAFFLLAGALNDAVEICLRRLKDLQLAMVIVRLYPGAGGQAAPLPETSVSSAMHSLLEQEVLASPAADPFLRSMAHWLLGNYTSALNTLLHNHSHLPDLGEDGHEEEKEVDKDERSVTSPSIFNFYIFLRSHPLLIRQQRAAENKGPFLPGSASVEVTSVSSLERRLYFTTAHAHFLAGCPALALQVLSQLPSEMIKDDEPGKQASQAPSVANGGKPREEKVSATDLDWSVPVSMTSKGNDELDLKWSDSEDEDESDEEDVGLQMKSKIEETTPDKEAESAVSSVPSLDIMAQQLKFIACLKILMEELSTLATGFEVDGGQLRLQLYVWLEREVEALNELCHYGATAAQTASIAAPDQYLTSFPGPEKGGFEFGEHEETDGSAAPTLHHVLQLEKSHLEAKVKRMERRRRWLKANESLLRTLQSYCALHGSAGGGLASVRMELILLLQELSQERRPWISRLGSRSMQTVPSIPSLMQPLPLPLSSVPLLAAATIPTRAMTTDPIRHLQTMISDILGTVTSLPCPPVPGQVSLPQICLLRDLGVALSACIYQSLCEADTAGQTSNSTTGEGNAKNNKHAQEQSHHAIGAWGALARLTVVYRDYHLIAASAPARKALERPHTEELSPTTSPQKWPGVTSLIAMLSREREEDSPRLLILLVEAFVAVYTSLLAYALAACDAHILFRLVSLSPDAQWWGRVFGGGAKQLLRVSAVPAPTSVPPPFDPDSKQRMRLHMKLLQGPPLQPTPSSSASLSSSSSQNATDGSPSYREVFVAPKMSIVAALMSKPSLSGDLAHVDYDSSASSDEEDAITEEDEEDLDDEHEDSDDGLSQRKAPPMAAHRSTRRPSNTQHSDPHSLAWVAIRLAVVRLAMQQLEAFFRVVAIEMNDLPVLSPLSYGAFRSLGQWEAALQHILQRQGPAPPTFLPACHLSTESETITGRPAPPLHKYRSILEPANTPFIRKPIARPLTRLWAYLVRQETVQDVFVRVIFAKGKLFTRSEGSQEVGPGASRRDTSYADEDNETDTIGDNGFTNRMFRDPVRIIHKDQEPIAAFCVNANNVGVLALATPKEIQELDITPLLDTPTWMEDECELDLLALDKDADSAHSTGFLVVQTPGDRALLASLQGGANGAGLAVGAASVGGASASSFSPQNIAAAAAAGRNTTLLKRHRVDNVKRLSAHPHLPLYLSGASDGCVQVWEWGHTGPLATPRASGAYAKVTRLKFNAQGNKFGVADADGKVSLWQLRLGSSASGPFLTQMCHAKGATDLAWLSCSSLLATAGHAHDGRNVALWDTLLPQRKALVHSWNCHEGGATCLYYAPQHQVLLSAGRRGDICVWDIRQRSLRQRFAAAEGNVAIKCLALDPAEENLVTGSAEGDVRVWAWSHPTGPRIVHAFPADHARSSFFRSMAQGQGVTQVSLDASGRLVSAGADGAMKLRLLPPRDAAVLAATSPYSSSWQG